MDKERFINVLFVDDEINNLNSFKSTFRRDFNVFLALSAKEAEHILEIEKNIHVLITDQKMPVKLGTELLAETVKKFPNQTRILLTAHASNEALIDAEERGQIFAYMEKPWNEELLKQYIINGYDFFYGKMLQRHRISKLQRFDKTLNKALKQYPKGKIK